MRRIDYHKYVIQQVAFDEHLFQKELMKAVFSLFNEERPALKNWCFSMFPTHRQRIIDVFESTFSSQSLNGSTVQKLCNEAFNLNSAFVKRGKIEVSDKVQSLLFRLTNIYKALGKDKEVQLSLLKSIIENLEKVDQQADPWKSMERYSLFSTDLFRFLRITGVPDKMTVFFQYCQFSLHKSGAFWIAKTEQINNPYSSIEPFDCGKVIEKIS